jgi:hypothetical protein
MPRGGHVLLDGSLADAVPELEELAANALGSPSRVLRGHLSDERGAGRGAASEPTGAAPPEPAKSDVMPPEYGGRLNEYGHGSPRRREACGEGHRVSLPRLPVRSADILALGYDQLLSQQRVLRDER